MTPEQALADNVRRLRGASSQENVAKALGWPKQRLSQIENGQRRITLNEAMALAVVLEVSPVHLFTPWKSPGTDYRVGTDKSYWSITAEEARWWIMGLGVPTFMAHPKRILLDHAPEWWADQAMKAYRWFSDQVVGSGWTWDEDGERMGLGRTGEEDD